MSNTNQSEIILLIAPFTNQHGQGRVSERVKEIICDNFNAITFSTHITGSFYLKSLKSLFLIFRVIFFIHTTSKRYKCIKVYFTPSRNFLGSIKDLIKFRFFVK